MSDKRGYSNRPAALTLTGDESTIGNPLFEGRKNTWTGNTLYEEARAARRRQSSVWVIGTEEPADVGQRDESKEDEIKKSWRRIAVPICAVSLHVCLGFTSAWSVFNRPIAVANPSWNSGSSAYAYALGVFFMGSVASVAGRLMRRLGGPRKLLTIASFVFSVGLGLIAVALAAGQEWLLYVAWMIVGTGVGLSYSPPVATLLKWFPDNVGLASGIAITGFGLGAVIGGPVSTALIPAVGIPATVGILTGVYFVIMVACSQVLEFPPTSLLKTVATPDVTLLQALRIPQFWIMWGILLVNVFSGGGVQGQLAPVLQDVFSLSPIVASGLVSGAQASNMVGRFLWATLSDKITRRWTYTIFFVCQCIIFGVLSVVARAQILPLFIVLIYIAFSMYGGGFACMPAFTADIWGAPNVVEVYGGILTAWGLSGSVGPILITVLRNSRLDLLTTDPTGIYEVTFYVMCAVCGAGIILPQKFILKSRVEKPPLDWESEAMTTPPPEAPRVEKRAGKVIKS